MLRERPKWKAEMTERLREGFKKKEKGREIFKKLNLSHELREETEELSDGESNPGLPRFVT